MSDFQIDIQERSERNKVSDPQIVASLRDQIPKKLLKALKDADIGNIISGIWNKGNAEKQEWLDKQKVFMGQWDDFVANLPEGPFDGASQLHLPTTFVHAKAIHARLMEALFGIEPPFVTKAKRESETPRLEMVDAIMKHAIIEWANHNEGIKEVISDWVWDYVTAGVGLLKVRWTREFTSFVDVEETVEVDEIEGDESGLPPDIRIIETEVLRKIKSFDGPIIELVRPEDLLIIGGGGNPQRAHSVTHRQWLTGSQLWSLVDQEVFEGEAVEKIIQFGETRKSSAIGGEIKQDRSINVGKSNADSEADLRQYEILETYMQYDVNKDGINEEIIVWIHSETKAVLRSTYLRRASQYGVRPFFKADFHRRSGEDYGVGMVEMMFSLSLEQDAMHNQAVDAGTIQNMPFGFYRASSSLDPEIIDLVPGAMYPVDNPQQDVNFPRLNGGHSFNLQMSQVIQDQINRLTGISDLNFGQLTAQGAARTATGTRALLGESNINLNVPLGNLARPWRQCLRFIFSMLQRNIPAGYSFRITGELGEDYWMEIKDRQELAGQFDFDISENSANSNRAIQQQVAQQINAITADPIAIQTGVVNQSGIFESKKILLQSLGVKDWSRYIAKPDAARRVLTPEEEVNRVLSGITVKVQLGDDHQGFIDLVQEMLKNPEVEQAYTIEQLGLLKAQAAEHVRALQAFEQLQAQARSRAQVSANQVQTDQTTEPVPQQTAAPQGTPES